MQRSDMSEIQNLNLAYPLLKY